MTFDWSEDVTGFAAEDVTVTGGTSSAFSGSGDSYSLTVTPSGNTDVVVSVTANTGTDGGGNTGPASAESETATWDATAPTVTIGGVPSAINSTSNLSVTFTWSEDVTGFDASDVTVTGGTASAFAGSGQSYSLTVTPSGNVNVVVTVTANTGTDGGGNTGPASAERATATWDATAPTVTITGVPSAINSTSNLNVTFTWSEDVTGFDAADVTVTGGTASSFSGNGDSYSLTVTPSGNTDVVVSVGANTGTDGGGNTGPSTAESETATWDATAPTVTIGGVPSAINSTNNLNVTFDWSEDVTGFDASDVTVTGGTATGFSGSGSSYSSDRDAVGQCQRGGERGGEHRHGRRRQHGPVHGGERNRDMGRDGADGGDRRGARGDQLDEQSERDVHLVGGRDGFRCLRRDGDGRHGERILRQRSVVQPDGDTGRERQRGSERGGEHGHGRRGQHGSGVGGERDGDWDATAPTVVIGGVPSAINSTSNLNVTFTWSEDVTDFDASDVTVTGGTAGAFSGSGSSYSLTVTPSGNTNVVVSVGANTGTDGGGNTGPAAVESETAVWDATAPTVTITGVPSAINSTNNLNVTFDWSEDVTGFDASDVTVTGGTSTGFAGSGQSYTLTVTPTGNTNVVVTVTANTGTDGGGNTGPAAAEVATATWDATAPTVSITGVPSAINSTSNLDVTFTWSEDVTGFDTADVTVTGARRAASPAAVSRTA